MLEKIIADGFKSFADRVEIDFSDGITAVIGPNGCGKSNVIDAVRWVLGEQSAKTLRGGKMEDVIFSGSDDRKPREKAEVTLVLDNSKGHFHRVSNKKISVTRIVYRKGGSEYLIDGEPSRLKDIHDIFLDSGIGSDSYSMIGQGEIGKILSNKVDERRAIFEEASGIVKLKKQKEQTEKRLKDVDSNLIRIEDIIKEIEKQLKPLQEQSKKAKEYNELSSELEKIETQFLLNELDSIEDKLVSSQNESKNLEEGLIGYKKDLSEKEEWLNQAKETFEKKNNSSFTTQEKAADLKESVENLKGNIALIDERHQNTKNQISNLVHSLEEIEQNHSLNTEDYMQKKERSVEIISSLNKLKQESDELNSIIKEFDVQKMQLSADLEYTRERSIELYNEINQMNFEREQNIQKEKNLKEKLNLFSHKKDELLREKYSSESDLSKVDKSFSDIKDEHLLIKQKVGEKEDELETLRNQNEEYIKSLQTLESELIKKRSSLESIETFLENNEGFYGGVKAILQAKKNNKINGIDGVVAELISVNKTAELAIETLLQGTMQFLVVENDSVAHQAITFLKEKKLGRATFLPINMSKPTYLNHDEKKLISQTDGITFALDHVSFEGKYAPVIESLLGRSLVAETLELGIEFIKKTHLRVKISTLEGEVIQTGSITGGATTSKKTNFFSKKREMNELVTEVDKLTSSVSKMKNDLQQGTLKYESTKNDYKQLQEKFNLLHDEYNEKEKIYEEAKHKLERISEKHEEINIDFKELSLALSETSDLVISLGIDLEERQSKYNKLKKSLETLTQQTSGNDSSIAGSIQRKTEISMEVSRLEEELKGLNEFLESFSEDSFSLEEKIKSLQERLTLEKNKLIELESEKKQLDHSLNDQTIELEKIHSNASSLRKENEELNLEIKNVEKEVKEINKKKEEVEKLYNQKQVYLSRKDTEKSNIFSRLEETYNITPEQSFSLERLDIDLSQSKKEISTLKNKISKLGNINHNAIEECDILEERYQNEHNQLKDIQKAKADLLLLLKNVEEEMVKRFKTTFDHIAEHFEKIFKDLFGGGNARLTLADPNDSLNSPIDIIAQPPGKKPQSINLLSGGEKAFTAVALIFAIISSKPSPFVILDEVDAPLDDANVARFAHYLKEFSQKTQFICITHRKGTMAVAASDPRGGIYGVTQQTRGVTIVFPHKINGEEEVI